MQVELRFYAELNDFLPSHRRHRSFEHTLVHPAAVKDVIESLAVPHTEVDLVIVNGESVGFDHVVGDGDRVAVYPVFESIDIGPVLEVRPAPLRDTRFVADVHLGRLARHLRLLGFDTWYRNDAGDDELARVSVDERRILLTRDRGLLKRSAVTHGSWLRSTDAEEQAVEVVRRFDLGRRLRPFSRCLVCNTAVEAVGPALNRCPGCGRLYWPGSHHERLAVLVDRIAAAAGPATGTDRGPRSPR